MIQEKINDSDIEYPIVIVPTFANVMANNDLREGISGQTERPVLHFGLLVIGQRIRRLNIYPFSAERRKAAGELAKKHTKNLRRSEQ